MIILEGNIIILEDIMIDDFLKKYRDELNSDRIQIKEDIDLLSTKIHEETKFLNILEESNETYFKEFTPRDINSKNKEKAIEVKNIINELSKELDSKTDKMKFIEGRLVEISNLLEFISNKDFKDSLNNNDSLNNLDGKSYSNISLLNQLKSINDIILLDPYKAKLDLENIISSL